MPTTLRNFAATLAAVGLLSFGSMTMGQQEAEQPPSDPSSIESIEQSADVADVRPADEDEAARPDTPPEDPNNPADETAVEADASVDADVSNENVNSNENANATPEASDEANNESREDEDGSSDRANSEDNIADINRDNADSNRDNADIGRDNQDRANEDKQLTPPDVPEQARDRETNSREDVNADWRMVDRDGVIWFYSPSGQWHIRQGNTWHAYHDGMHYSDLNPGYRAYGDRSVVRDDARMRNYGSQQYSTGYRGEQVYDSDQGQHYGQHVRYDRCGRAYVCVNGRAMYVDVNEHSQNGQPSDDRQPTMADEQYQDVPPPPAEDDRNNASDNRSNVPAPPAPPSGA